MKKKLDNNISPFEEFLKVLEVSILHISTF